MTKTIFNEFVLSETERFGTGLLGTVQKLAKVIPDTRRFSYKGFGRF
jgi:hypothetical protein